MKADPTGINSQQAINMAEVKLNDTLMRIIGIPLFGVIIPHISGLFGELTIRDASYWLGYPYFILLSAAIWHGNRYLMFRTRKRFTWFDKPIEKLILLFLNNIFFTSPLTIAWLCLWYRWAGFEKINWDIILIVTLIDIICVLFVINIYETVFMLKEQQNEQLRNAELSRAKAEAELEALKNQIDPHFMFNSLNSLSYLITSDAKKALEFTENLADIYRYILSQKEQSLVLLEDELNFTQKYIVLLELRFGRAIRIKKHFDLNAEKDYLVPPISAFVAIENVVKHNEFSERIPLNVNIEIKDGSLIITNEKREKKNIKHSSKIGLKNLDERFKIIIGKNIVTDNQNRNFTVNLPLIQINN